MENKYRILEILAQNGGEAVSGEDIAKKLNISRNAVCKAISALKKEGYNFVSAPNRGYTLLPSDVLNAEEIENLVKIKGLQGIRVKCFGSVESTNDIAKEWANNGAEEGIAAIAACQTAGRGRKGRKFESPENSGIYLSLVLRPLFSAADSLYITVAAAVAAARAIEQEGGKKAQIKWVNDVFCGNKKVCGILTEAAVNMETLGLDYAVLGIGINVYEPDGGFPAEIKDIAGAVSAQGPINGLRNRIVAAFLAEFFGLYKGGINAGFMDEYRKRSNVLGKKITVFQGNDVYDAEALDIDDRGGLIVKTESGETRILQSGEVSIRKYEQTEI